jgi:hypothetical protein
MKLEFIGVIFIIIAIIYSFYKKKNNIAIDLTITLFATLSLLYLL